MERHGSREVSTADLWTLINPTDGDAIELGLGDASEKSQRIRLGKLLLAKRDWRVGNYQIIPAGKRHGAVLWKLVEC